MAFTDYIDVANWGIFKWALAGFAALVLFYDLFLVLNYKIRAKLAGGGSIYLRTSWPFGIPAILFILYASATNRALEFQSETFRKVGRKTFAQELTFAFNIVTGDPENIKSILATDFKSYSLGLRAEQLGAFLGPGIFTLSGSGWKHSRTMLRPQFSREQVGQLESLHEHVNKLLARFTENPGQQVDAQDLFHRLTMDTATEFLFAESVESLSDSQRVVNGVSAQQFVRDYNTGLDWSLFRLLAGPLYVFIKPKKFRDAVERSRRFVDHFVHKALDATEKNTPEDNTSSYYFSYELAKVTRDPVVIRDQAFNVLLAGRDTTASLLSYTVWYLGSYPEIYARLRQVVLEEFGTDTSKITFESLKRCRYLRNVINEVLRLNPIVPRNFRTAIKDTFLPRGGGKNGNEPVFVPKGTQVFYSVYEVQRNPEYWGADALEFNPDRWESSQSRGWEYLPFNGGPRICLGQQFALTEASYTILRIAQNFERLELRNTDPELRNFVRLTANVSGGVPVIVHPARK